VSLDLILLVPGKDEREALEGLLECRRPSLGIRDIRYELLVASMRDPGCFQSADALLRPFHHRATHALVLFDHYGSGQEDRPVPEVEAEVRSRLAGAGWGDRADALVLSPELETWVWSASRHVDQELGWEGRNPALRDWLRNQGYWPDAHLKPQEPKRALKAALREVRKPQSPRMFRRLAERVSLDRCQDSAFRKLLTLLRQWFPAA
jgi:hypothetical protein